jgi:hypothetical protein
MCDNRSDHIINYEITLLIAYLNLKTNKFIYWNLPRLNGGGYRHLILSTATCSEIFLYFTAVLSDLKPKLKSGFCGM